MAKNMNFVLKRQRTIDTLENVNMNLMIEDFSELMNDDFMELESPIHTKGYDSQLYDVYGITLMCVNDNNGEIIGEEPAFYLGDARHMEYITELPYEVVLNVYRTVFNN